MDNSPKKSDTSIPFTHVLQRTGLLKAFGVAKIVRGRELHELKQLIKSVAKSKQEYESMLQEELDKLSSMPDEKNPIPGMVFILGDQTKSEAVVGAAKAYAKKLKQLGWTKDVICIYILALIKELGLSQVDFDDVQRDDTDDDDEDDDDE